MEQTLAGILACHPVSMAESLVSSTCCLGLNPASSLCKLCDFGQIAVPPSVSRTPLWNGDKGSA